MVEALLFEVKFGVFAQSDNEAKQKGKGKVNKVVIMFLIFAK